MLGDLLKKAPPALLGPTPLRNGLQSSITEGRELEENRSLLNIYYMLSVIPSIYIIPMATISNKNYYPHFIGEETEAQREG